MFCIPALRTVANGTYCRIMKELSLDSLVAVPASCHNHLLLKTPSTGNYYNSTAPHVRLLYGIRRHWTLFPWEMLDAVVETNLTDLGTAFLATKD